MQYTNDRVWHGFVIIRGPRIQADAEKDKESSPDEKGE